MRLSAEEQQTLEHVLGGPMTDGIVAVNDACRVVKLSGHPDAELVCLGCEKFGFRCGYSINDSGVGAWHRAA
ncbi:hypothetical protein [Lentzea sp. CA-135723]|uniref:hypothetical protein n=1 Tax=Lentzea sp. CA-135723 TaxID=3239950 RepID=UPI003D8FC050